MSDQPVKITDRRMFTMNGELREEFRHLGEESAASRREDAPPAAERPAAEPPASDRIAAPAPAPELEPLAPVEGYPEPAVGGGPGFLDLVGLLAEPASIYLREAHAGTPGTVAGDAKVDQSLELARLHIDLLAILREKTAGNLEAQERMMVDDVLYRLRMGYVQSQR